VNLRRGDAPSNASRLRSSEAAPSPLARHNLPAARPPALRHRLRDSPKLRRLRSSPAAATVRRDGPRGAAVDAGSTHSLAVQDASHASAHHSSVLLHSGALPQQPCPIRTVDASVRHQPSRHAPADPPAPRTPHPHPPRTPQRRRVAPGTAQTRPIPAAPPPPAIPPSPRRRGPGPAQSAAAARPHRPCRCSAGQRVRRRGGPGGSGAAARGVPGNPTAGPHVVPSQPTGLPAAHGAGPCPGFAAGRGPAVSGAGHHRDPRLRRGRTARHGGDEDDEEDHDVTHARGAAPPHRPAASAPASGRVRRSSGTIPAGRVTKETM
jgi:hypothetical protein